MNEPHTEAERLTLDILARWPNRQAIAEDCGCELHAVHRWFLRMRIPVEYMDPLLEGAQRRQITVTSDELIASRSVRLTSPREAAA